MSSEMTGAIADRYALALFDLADQQGALDQIANDLRSLKAMITESTDLRRLLRSPVISRADQQRAITGLAAKAGLSDLATRFLGLVARNRRLFALPGMIESYLAQLAGRRGEVAAQVISAAPLNEAQRAELSAILRKSTGGSVAIEESVDPQLLGGMVVKVGSRMVDSSLRTKLQHLKLAMKGVG